LNCAACDEGIETFGCLASCFAAGAIKGISLILKRLLGTFYTFEDFVGIFAGCSEFAVGDPQDTIVAQGFARVLSAQEVTNPRYESRDFGYLGVAKLQVKNTPKKVFTARHFLF
jgi:hypothetical protein